MVEERACVTHQTIYALFAVYFPESGAPGSNEYVLFGLYSTLELAKAQQPGLWYINPNGEWWQHIGDGAFAITEEELDKPTERSA